MDFGLKLLKLQTFLETLSIDVMKLEFLTRECSGWAANVEVTPYPSYPKHTEFRSKSVPMLIIYVRTTENFQSLNITGQSTNYDGTYSGTNSIRKMWQSLVNGESQVSNLYDDDMLVRFFNYPQSEVRSAILKNMNQIESLVSVMDIIQPEAVYTHTDMKGVITGYRVIYKNEQDYLNAKANGDFEAINSKILQFIQECTVDIDNEEVLNFLEILFIHLDMSCRSEWFSVLIEDFL